MDIIVQLRRGKEHSFIDDSSYSRTNSDPEQGLESAATSTKECFLPILNCTIMPIKNFWWKLKEHFACVKVVLSRSNSWLTALEENDQDCIRPTVCCWSLFNESIRYQPLFKTLWLHSLSLGIQGPLEITYLIGLALTVAVISLITLQRIDN